MRMVLRLGPPARGILVVLLLAAAAAGAAETPRRIAGSERVQVSLVLIDIVVRDRKDQPVPSLTRDDFELRIDGAAVDPSDIESFEEVCGEPATVSPEAGTVTTSGTAPAPAVAPPGPPRHIVIYFDFAHLSFDGARMAMRAARDQIAQHHDPADRVMILAYKHGLRLVQDFTNDAALLVSRIDAMRSDRATIETEVGEEDDNALEVRLLPCPDPDCGFRRAAASARATREEMRGRQSLEALTSVMPALAGLKGRKAVILYSDALRQQPGAEYYVFTNVTPGEDGISLEREMLTLAAEANAARVSIYTVYASGMTVGEGGTDPISLSHAAGNDSARALQTSLAVDTGGRAFRNTNDVGAVLTSAARDLSCYYLLGYRSAGPGDNKRHSVMVKLKRDRQTVRGQGLTLRYRPYYNDQSAEDRRDRLVRSAELAPALFHEIPVMGEAYALAPTRPGRSARAGRRVLIKATVPIAPLSLVPTSDAWFEGRIALRGNVTTANGKQVFDFDHEMPLRIPRSELETARLIYETGCVLAPDTYTLSLIALDPVTLEIGALRTPLVVSKPEMKSGGYLSELYLWTRVPEALLVTSGLGSIGLPDGVSTHGLIPQPERRMSGKRDAALSFALCLARESQAATTTRPVRVIRSLTGDNGVKVSGFEDLIISEPPDPETGCYQVSTLLRGATLGHGIYRFAVEVSGGELDAPLSREVDLAVIPER